MQHVRISSDPGVVLLMLPSMRSRRHLTFGSWSIPARFQDQGRGCAVLVYLLLASICWSARCTPLIVSEHATLRLTFLQFLGKKNNNSAPLHFYAKGLQAFGPARLLQPVQPPCRYASPSRDGPENLSLGVSLESGLDRDGVFVTTRSPPGSAYQSGSSTCNSPSTDFPIEYDPYQTLGKSRCPEHGLSQQVCFPDPDGFNKCHSEKHGRCWRTDMSGSVHHAGRFKGGLG